MPTLSVDLAYKDYRDIGVVTLDTLNGRIIASAVPLATRGLKGAPTVTALADALVALATEIGADWIFIDGPQGWKAPDNGLQHARVCERALATQGKTGLPGVCKPGNYIGFITFAVELFDVLDSRGWPRLQMSAVPPSKHCAIESFPTSAWRSLGLTPLPGKVATTRAMVLTSIQSLRATFPLDVADDLSHDELQALVAGLAGVALDEGNKGGFSIAGVPPIQLNGTWREGFIVNPTRRTAGSFTQHAPLEPMMERRCLHGLDARFCAICNKPTPAARDGERTAFVPDASLAEILRFLNDQKVRATYGAVAHIVGGIAQSIGARIGGREGRRPEASWVVNATTGLPTDYSSGEMHPALDRSEIITTGDELRRRLVAWRATRQGPA